MNNNRNQGNTQNSSLSGLLPGTRTMRKTIKMPSSFLQYIYIYSFYFILSSSLHAIYYGSTITRPPSSSSSIYLYAFIPTQTTYSIPHHLYYYHPSTSHNSRVTSSGSCSQLNYKQEERGRTTSNGIEIDIDLHEETDTTSILDTETRRQLSLDRLKNAANSFWMKQPQMQPLPELSMPSLSSTSKITSCSSNDDSTNVPIPSVASISTTKPNMKQKSSSSSSILGKSFLPDTNQQNTITSEAPAILIDSGPGTGKTTVLAGRIAHLLKTKQSAPQNIIVLSFTKRDASALRDKAIDLLFNNDDNSSAIDNSDQNEAKEDIKRRLWSGTIHSFAKNILQMDDQQQQVRIISNREIRNRIKRCLQHLPKSKLQEALQESNQNMGTLVHYLIRCIELWKEAGVLPAPYSPSPTFLEKIDSNDDNHDDDEETNNLKDEERRERDVCVELAMRLGIPKSAASLALEISGEYQTLHASAGTADPSDVATMAYNFLLTNPEQFNKVRSKLKHMILDEYQDVSVAQHRLIRLLVRGTTDQSEATTPLGIFHQDEERKRASERKKDSIPFFEIPVLLGLKSSRLHKKKKQTASNSTPCFDVPRLMCAGDIDQSIYGWRGAAPSLTIDGFRKDFPQGVLVPLNTCYRLSRHILNAANVLINRENGENMQSSSTDHPYIQEQNVARSFDISPAAAKSASRWVIDDEKSDIDPSSQIPSSSSQDINDDSFDTKTYSLGRKLLIKDGLMSESQSDVFIHSLWDIREEAKYIASSIKKRSTERICTCASALNNFMKSDEDDDASFPSFKDHQNLFDSTDVAIMVRSSNQIKLFEEALKDQGIPYTIPFDSTSDQETAMQQHRRRKVKTLAMKPVKLITMHRAKGDEFDDVYLASWTEGVFPHPSSVSTNRLHEERRIAYVALTRARQRVVLTYSIISRTAYFSPEGARKDVTEQCEPSRFLFDLVGKRPKYSSDATSSSSTEGNNHHGRETPTPGVEWSEKVGFKEVVAGRDLPSHFAKAFRIPGGFKRQNENHHHEVSSVTPTKAGDNPTKKEQKGASTHSLPTKIPQPKSPSTINAFQKLILTLRGVFRRKRGTLTKNRLFFKSMLSNLFGIKRGSALVLSNSSERGIEYNQKTVDEKELAMDVLVHAKKEDLSTRAISRCTAEQLGLYLYYLFVTNHTIP